MGFPELLAGRLIVRVVYKALPSRSVGRMLVGANFQVHRGVPPAATSTVGTAIAHRIPPDKGEVLHGQDKIFRHISRTFVQPCHLWRGRWSSHNWRFGTDEASGKPTHPAPLPTRRLRDQFLLPSREPTSSASSAVLNLLTKRCFVGLPPVAERSKRP